MTIFIHGTVQSGTAVLLEPERTWKDIFTGESWCEQIIHASRAEGAAYKSDLMLEHGLVEIPVEYLTGSLPPEVQQRAAYHIIRAFHTFNAMEHTADTSQSVTTQHYYTFGWSGLLSETERRHAAVHLYDLLRKEYTRLRGAHNQVTIELYGYSHGGQLILHLPVIRSQRKEADFFIDLVVLSGTPLYYHNARNIIRGMFKQVVNFFSLGDSIQLCDIFSTPHRTCRRSFASLKLPLPSQQTASCFVADVQLQAHDNKNFFGHGSFFILNRHSYPRAARRRSLYRALITSLQPLPLVAIYPPLIKAFKELRGYHQITANLIAYEKEIAITLHTETATDGESHIRTVKIPGTKLQEVRQEIATAYGSRSYLSEIGKALHTFKHAVITLCQNQLRKTRIFIRRTASC